jgi:hypothetical protein
LKEQKTFILTTLTVIFLALSNLLTTGKFIFTFPVNDFILLFVSIYFYFINTDKNKINSVLLVIFSLFIFGSNYYNFEFFLNTIQLTKLTNSLFTDIFQFLALLVYLSIYLKFNLKKNIFFNWLLFGINAALIVLIQFEITNFLNLFTYIFLPVSIFITDRKDTIPYKSIYYFFLIVNVLNITKFISIYF